MPSKTPIRSVPSRSRSRNAPDPTKSGRRLTSHPGVDEGEILAQLFRAMLDDLQVTDARWLALLRNWVQRPENRIPADFHTRQKEIQRLNKRLRARRMSWPTFLLGMRLLNPRGFDLAVIPRWHSGRKTHHTLIVQLRPPADETPTHSDSRS